MCSIYNIEMVSKLAEKYLLDILEKAVKHGDSCEIQNVFKNNNFAVENLNVVISKVGNIIYSCQSNLPGFEITIQNILKVLLDLIQVTEFNFTQSVYLTRLLLNIATDQSCTINIMKGAIPAVNHFLQNSSIAQSILNDESLEGTIQILGRSIPYIGDYECQVLLLETLYRITENGNRRQWAKVWFQDMQTRSLFLNMNPNSFELQSRRALNYINKKEVECRVFSFVAKTVKFGDVW
ncbi:uncharacterized protein LOC118179839, partial [Stegodyphus dumicola]|uniref:uncharacterized protein LOC118179839 n=1 Tax=Stegodyphus dumicola TaxID=202533 RepID=UPI0015A997BC